MHRRHGRSIPAPHASAARSRPSTRAPNGDDGYIGPLIQALAALTRVADRLGVAFAVLVGLLTTVWVLGSAQTRDDFLRELLFGSITHTRYLALFFAALLAV